MAQPFNLARRPITTAAVPTVSSTVSRTAIPSTLIASNARNSSSLHTTSRRAPRQCSQRQRSNNFAPRRAYHSRHHPPFPPHYTYPESPSANSILTAALAHVPRHGFTNEALVLGARDAGYLDVSVQLFPRGAFEIILFYLASRRELLKERVQKGEVFGDAEDGGKGMSGDEKVKRLVMERLRMNEGIINQWQDALALLSLPTHVPASLSELHSLSSDILTLASDPSVDASWYTKRLSLAAVYASAEVVMTQDSSPNFASTEAFVQRRLDDSQSLGETASDVKGFLGFMATSAAGLGRSWGLKI